MLPIAAYVSTAPARQLVPVGMLVRANNCLSGKTIPAELHTDV